MKDIEKAISIINAITAPIEAATEIINKAIPPYIQEISRVTTPICRAIQEILIEFQPYYEQFSINAVKIAKAAQDWQERRMVDVTVMAESGWYPNWFTFFFNPDSEPQSLDHLMQMHLTENWQDITDNILELCPNRRAILESAFDLHKSGNYIAAIPLFLAQADGICCESLKSFLFTGGDTESNIDRLIESGEIEANMFTDIFIKPFKLKNHHNAGIRDSGEKAKSRAPNRNGILHGHRKHLDYGTEINSLKCFSLLSFVVYTAKEIFVSNKVQSEI